MLRPSPLPSPRGDEGIGTPRVQKRDGHPGQCALVLVFAQRHIPHVEVAVLDSPVPAPRPALLDVLEADALPTQAAASLLFLQRGVIISHKRSL